MRKRAAVEAAALFALWLAGPAFAVTVVVDPDATQGDHTTIAQALTAAAVAGSGIDRILVHRGTYSEPLTLVPNVTLEGEETAATKLTGPITFAAGATLQRFTVSGATKLSGISSGTIRNNIFTNVAGSAVLVELANNADSAVNILNNTFYQNTRGVELASASSALIEGNIFVGHTTAVSRFNAASGVIRNNRYDQNTVNVSAGIGTNETLGDPRFVNTSPTSLDFHVATDSPACGLGAFGDRAAGSAPDTTPSPVTGLTAELVDGKVRLGWNGNAACDSDVAAYRVNFKTPADAVYIFLAETPESGSGVHTFTVDPAIHDLGDPPSPPAVPTGVAISPIDGGLQVSWTQVNGADGYIVTWGERADALVHRQDAGNSRNDVVEGLTNGKTYFAAVSAYAAQRRQFAVTAVPAVAPAVESDGESRIAEEVEAVMATVESGSSSVGSGVPESVSGFPALDDNGACFVGTVAPRGNWGWFRWGFGFLGGVLACGAAVGLRRSAAILAGLLMLAGLLPASAAAAGPIPRWIFSLSGGQFTPEQENWDDHYDDSHLLQGKLGLGFRILRQIEIGIEGGYHSADGEVKQTDAGTPIDPPQEQTLTVVPLHAYLLLQLLISERQWVVPYVAGGYSWYWYRHEIENDDTVTGHQDGYHVRGGLKILLDVLDPYFAQRAEESWGLDNTYLTIEAQYAKVDNQGKSDTDLGGISYFAGFVMEF